MTDSHYLLTILVLSAFGIFFSYMNCKIVKCPRNRKHNRTLDAGFIFLFVLALVIVLTDVDIMVMRYGLLVFLMLSVIHVGDATVKHLFKHASRKNHMCRHRTYKENLGRLLDERVDGAG